MWKLRSIKETYETLSGEERETFSMDEQLDICFESRLEAIMYVANIRRVSPYDGSFHIYYESDGSVKLEVGVQVFADYVYYMYRIDKM